MQIDEPIGDGTLAEDGLEVDPATELSLQDDGELDGGGEEPKGTEKALRDAKAELTRKSQESAEYRDKLMRLEAQMEVLLKQGGNGGAAPKNEPDPMSFIYDEEFTSTILDDPKNVAKAVRATYETVGKRYNDLIDYVQGQFEKMRGEMEQRSPERQSLQAEIAKLKEDPDYATLPDAALVVIAKKQRKAGGDQQRREYPGGPIQGRRASASPMDREIDRKATEILKRWGEE